MIIRVLSNRLPRSERTLTIKIEPRRREAVDFSFADPAARCRRCNRAGRFRQETVDRQDGREHLVEGTEARFHAIAGGGDGFQEVWRSIALQVLPARHHCRTAGTRKNWCRLQDSNL